MNCDLSPTALREHGYGIAENVLSQDSIRRMQESLASSQPNQTSVGRRQAVYGIRNLLEHNDIVRQIARDATIRDLIVPHLGNEAFAARAIFFDKLAVANWGLGWHQDRAISVRSRIADAPGFRAWSNKSGVWQVQPPAEILASMLAVRIHLDDCGSDNGPLSVLPGSHRCGLVNDIERWKQTTHSVDCIVKRGGVVLMRPLLLHASRLAKRPDRRRVVHIEYANTMLPGRLEWNQQVR